MTATTAPHIPTHPAWLEFVNVSDPPETVPAGAVVEPAGGYDPRGRIRVRRCTGNDSLAVYFNSPMAVEAGSPGLPDEDRPGGLCRPAFPLAAAAVHPDDLDAFAPPTAAGTRADDWFLRLAGKGFRFVDPLADGFANVLPDPAAVAGAGAAAWSHTAAGILSTATQSGAGRKNSTKGTDDSPGGWWVGMNSDPVPPWDSGPTLYGPIFHTPYLSTWSSRGSGFAVQHSVIASGDYDAPFSLPRTVTGIYCTNQVDAGFSIVARVPTLSFAVNDSFIPLVIAGFPADPFIPGFDQGGRNAAFAVWRPPEPPSAKATLKVGIDRDFAAGELPVVRGGLTVGVATSPPPLAPPPPAGPPPPPPLEPAVKPPPPPPSSPPVVSPGTTLPPGTVSVFDDETGELIGFIPPGGGFTPYSPPPAPARTVQTADVIGGGTVTAAKLYLTSPNGERWEVGVSNAGAMTITSADSTEIIPEI